MDLFLSVSNSYQFEFCFLFSTSIQFLHDIVLEAYKNSIMYSRIYSSHPFYHLN